MAPKTINTPEQVRADLLNEERNIWQPKKTFVPIRERKNRDLSRFAGGEENR